MVKVGFICEGDTEFFLLQSQMFRDILSDFNITPVNIVNARGWGNLLPHNISGYVKSLENMNAAVIVILTDLDTDACITQTKQRISARPQDEVIVAVRQIESWFLASEVAMQRILNDGSFIFEFPENEITPFDTVNNLIINYTGRGIGKNSTGSKVRLANRLLSNGLNLRDAALHPNCSSLKYFINKLKKIGSVI